VAACRPRLLDVPRRRGRSRLHQHQTLTEITARDDVDNEVDRRVKDDEEVADSRVVVVPVTARTSFFLHERPQDVVDKVC